MGFMIRILIFVVLGLVIMYWWRGLGVKKSQQRSKQGGGSASGQRSGTQKNPPQQTITCCKHCGVFTPEEEVIYGRLGGYCSQAHRLLDEQAHQKK